MAPFPLTRASAVLCATIALAACSDSNNSNGDDDSGFSLSILHINDHHSHLAASTFSYDVSALGLQTKTDGGADIGSVTVSYGGFPMLTSLADRLADEKRNVLKLHSGDAVTGTLYFTLFGGEADAEMMNRICFDAFALGNHEFDNGDAGLASFLNYLAADDCATEVLAANVAPGDASPIAQGYIKPYVIKEVGGQKIGLIGIDIAQKTQESSRPDAGTTLLDETATAQKYIDEISAQGVNKIILMTHYTYTNDQTLAANLTGVDVIVGGDSHTLMGGETFTQLGFNVVSDYPKKATDKAGDAVCIVHAWEYAHLLGALDVTFDDNGKITACSGNPYMPVAKTFTYAAADKVTNPLPAADADRVTQALTSHKEILSTTPDAISERLLAIYDDEVDTLKQTVIGTVSENLCLVRWPGESRSSLCDVSENYVNGSDISNIVAKAFLTVTPTADIAIQNGGGVRTDIPMGDFTVADAYTLLPFSNTLVTLQMTGRQIVDVLEDALSNTLDNNGSSGSYPYAAGLRFNVDASQTKGARLSNVEVNSRVAGDWNAIDLNATYTVVTNDFIASGQDGYTTFATPYNAGLYVDTFTEYAQGFVDYVDALTEDGMTVDKLPIAEYSTQHYIGRDGCNHSLSADCENY
ncbi:5'-nucleotidase/2',3'-cyclic phosphodiesterase and related esterases [Hahella chejuensis KCTC 2396]|uniref:5'-nucleotidase/2',3'-cyclic phosphodiesterase and related esterases n=1 Tax=Hahella chejuensis (strain KCTC 2396) TaxID=349521 RepID=Q2SPV4_HAHCH|nr:5'-nucleotidase C-terminal domain-containing protein [Hahella chejuensis]ABC27320.1 5'-nucleotidase/2',3'-cyclic phosphodiesterase and related esterases [Hahella chejuensis KCTC 2396]